MGVWGVETNRCATAGSGVWAVAMFEVVYSEVDGLDTMELCDACELFHVFLKFFLDGIATFSSKMYLITNDESASRHILNCGLSNIISACVVPSVTCQYK